VTSLRLFVGQPEGISKESLSGYESISPTASAGAALNPYSLPPGVVLHVTTHDFLSLTRRGQWRCNLAIRVAGGRLQLVDELGRGSTPQEDLCLTIPVENF
jgi:hypothetical protein